MEEPGAARLKLAAREFRDGALDLARAEEAETEEVPASEHPLEILEVPSADVIRGAEMLLGPRRSPDPPDRSAGRDVVLEDRLLVVRAEGVQILELFLGQIGHLAPPSEAEQGAASRKGDGMLDLGRERSPG